VIGNRVTKNGRRGMVEDGSKLCRQCWRFSSTKRLIGKWYSRMQITSSMAFHVSHNMVSRKRTYKPEEYGVFELQLKLGIVISDWFTSRESVITNVECTCVSKLVVYCQNISFSTLTRSLRKRDESCALHRGRCRMSYRCVKNNVRHSCSPSYHTISPGDRLYA
jgi:hypothetical protein